MDLLPLSQGGQLGDGSEHADQRRSVELQPRNFEAVEPAEGLQQEAVVSASIDHARPRDDVFALHPLENARSVAALPALAVRIDEHVLQEEVRQPAPGDESVDLFHLRSASVGAESPQDGHKHHGVDLRACSQSIFERTNGLGIVKTLDVSGDHCRPGNMVPLGHCVEHPSCMFCAGAPGIHVDQRVPHLQVAVERVPHCVGVDLSSS